MAEGADSSPQVFLAHKKPETMTDASSHEHQSADRCRETSSDIFAAGFRIYRTDAGWLVLPVSSFSGSGKNQLPVDQEDTVPLSGIHGSIFGKVLERIETSTEIHVPEVCIRILGESNEETEEVKDSKLNDEPIEKVSAIFAAIGGQFLGSMAVNAVNSTTPSPTAKPFLELATFIGLSVTLAGITQLRKRRTLSVRMTKIGAVITASSIIISLALQLPLVIALIFGLLAFLGLAAAVAFA